jgi:hypothetical protein
VNKKGTFLRQRIKLFAELGSSNKKEKKPGIYMTEQPVMHGLKNSDDLLSRNPHFFTSFLHDRLSQKSTAKRSTKETEFS